MQPIIMVTGIPGVGKTTISKNPLVGDIGVLVQTFGELMLFKGKELGLVQTGAELAKIPLHIRQKLQMMAAERILNDAKSMPVVIDGHLLVDTPTGFVPGLPYECVTSLGLSAIIILTAPASDILSRRENNKAKYQLMNGRSGIDRIAFHEELLVKASLQYAILSGASLECIPNDQDKIEDTVKSLIMLLGKLIPDLLQ
jgi:adenylate kinase